MHSHTEPLHIAGKYTFTFQNLSKRFGGDQIMIRLWSDQIMIRLFQRSSFVHQMIVAGYILAIYRNSQEEQRRATPGATPIRRRGSTQESQLVADETTTPHTVTYAQSLIDGELSQRLFSWVKMNSPSIVLGTAVTVVIPTDSFKHYFFISCNKPQGTLTGYIIR